MTTLYPGGEQINGSLVEVYRGIKIYDVSRGTGYKYLALEPLKRGVKRNRHYAFANTMELAHNYIDNWQG